MLISVTLNSFYSFLTLLQLALHMPGTVIVSELLLADATEAKGMWQKGTLRRIWDKSSSCSITQVS